MTGREIKEQVSTEIHDLIDDTEYYTAAEFAAKYGYKESTIRQMIHRGQISRVVRLYGRWLISENADILVRQYTKKNKYVL